MKINLILTVVIAYFFLDGCMQSSSSQKKLLSIKKDFVKRPFLKEISNDEPISGYLQGTMISIFRSAGNGMRIDNFTINKTTKKISGDANFYYYNWAAPPPDANDYVQQKGGTWDSFVKLSPDAICAACSNYRARLDSLANPKSTTEHYNLSGFATHDSVFFQVDTVYPVNENGELLERHLRFRGKGMKYSITNDYPPHHFIIGTFIDSTLEVSPYYGTFILGD